MEKAKCTDVSDETVGMPGERKIRLQLGALSAFGRLREDLAVEVEALLLRSHLRSEYRKPLKT